MSAQDQERMPDVREYRMYRFTSRLASSLDPEIEPPLTLFVYKYDTDQAARARLESYLEEAKDWKNKSPEYSFTKDNLLFRLIGDCVVSEESWKGIAGELTISLFGRDEQPDSVLRLSCDHRPEIKVPEKEPETKPTLKRRGSN